MGCAADEACAAAYPELETVFWDTVAALETQSASINIIDFQSGASYDSFVDGDGLVGVVFPGPLFGWKSFPCCPN